MGHAGNLLSMLEYSQIVKIQLTKMCFNFFLIGGLKLSTLKHLASEGPLRRMLWVLQALFTVTIRLLPSTPAPLERNCLDNSASNNSQYSLKIEIPQVAEISNLKNEEITKKCSLWRGETNPNTFEYFSTHFSRPESTLFSLYCSSQLSRKPERWLNVFPIIFPQC